MMATIIFTEEGSTSCKWEYIKAIKATLSKTCKRHALIIITQTFELVLFRKWGLVNFYPHGVSSSSAKSPEVFLFHVLVKLLKFLRFLFNGGVVKK